MRKKRTRRLYRFIEEASRHAALGWIAAGVAGPLDRAEFEQLDVLGVEIIPHRLLSEEIGAEIFFVVIGENCNDDCVGAYLILRNQRTYKICA